MPGQTLTTDAIILGRRPASDAFQSFTAFSVEQGSLQLQQRLPQKISANSVLLDLFDEASLSLETSNQGRSWFVKEVRILARQTAIGHSYDALERASAFATLVARNEVPEEGREKVYLLLRLALGAFATSERADIVYLKSLYCFARDEGYPVRAQWLESLNSTDRGTVTMVLQQPVAGQTAPPETVARLQHRLEDYLRGYTEILLE